MKIKVTVSHKETDYENLIHDTIPPEKPIGITFSDKSGFYESAENDVDTNQAIYDKQNDVTFKTRMYDMVHNNTIPWRNYLVYLILLTSLSCAMTFSKYMTRVESDTTVSAARFDVNITAVKSDGSAFENGSALNFNQIDEYSVIKYTVQNDSEVTVRVTMTVNSAGCSFCVGEGSFQSGTVRYELPETIASNGKIEIPLKVSGSTAASGALDVNFEYEQVKA